MANEIKKLLNNEYISRYYIISLYLMKSKYIFDSHIFFHNIYISVNRQLRNKRYYERKKYKKEVQTILNNKVCSDISNIIVSFI